MKRQKVIKRIITNLKVCRYYAKMLDNEPLANAFEHIIDDMGEDLKEELNSSLLGTMEKNDN